MAESIVLAAMVAILQLSGSARALTEPDCPVMEGTRKLLVNKLEAATSTYGPGLATSARQGVPEEARWPLGTCTEASSSSRIVILICSALQSLQPHSPGSPFLTVLGYIGASFDS